jgi:hypothetical protein
LHSKTEFFTDLAILGFFSKFSNHYDPLRYYVVQNKTWLYNQQMQDNNAINRPTYKNIQKWVKDNYGFIPKTCWIAHCKEMCNLPVAKAPNRQNTARMVPCQKEKQEAIKSAFKHYGLI